MSSMASREDHQTDVSHHATAIARWDDEGGAFKSARSNTGVRVSKEVRPKWMAESKVDLKLDQASGNDKKILECLGAAVIMRWVLSRPKSNGSSSNTRLRWPTSRRQLPRRAKSRASCIITRMTALRRQGPRCAALYCEAESAVRRLIQRQDVSAERAFHGYERAACGHGGFPLRRVLRGDGVQAR
jgi:hypothetical protein